MSNASQIKAQFNFTNLERRLRKNLGRAIGDHKMIEDGDKIRE